MVSKHDANDADYLKSEDLGRVIAKGMAVLYKSQPTNPVDFLGKWLLNVAHTQKMAVSDQQALAAVRAAQLKHDKECADNQTAATSQKEKAAQWTNQINSFNNLIDNSQDLGDQLQNLNDHLKVGTKATAVYIGKMVLPKKPISDTDNDSAHVSEGAEAQIVYQYSDSEHGFLIDKVLKRDTGVTYDLYNAEEPAEEAPAEEEPELDEEGNPIPKPAKEPVEVLPKYKIVDEVVREPKIHFFKVPKLGSYIAICLEYQTCLFEEALDAGIADQLDVNQKLRVQADERAAFEKAQADAEEEAEANGETYTKQEWQGEEIVTKSYITKKVQFVCCLNSMGQDRQFTPDERLFALRTVQRYRDRWEECERDNLKADIESKINKMDMTRSYKEQNEPLDLQELEQRADQAVQ
jgi:hypothetical protein